jgi:hypothetical protein
MQELCQHTVLVVCLGQWRSAPLSGSDSNMENQDIWQQLSIQAGGVEHWKYLL